MGGKNICFQFHSLVSGETKNSTNNCKMLGKAVIEGIEIEDLSKKAVVPVRLIWLQRAEAQAHSAGAGFTEKMFTKV